QADPPTELGTAPRSFRHSGQKQWSTSPFSLTALLEVREEGCRGRRGGEAEAAGCSEGSRFRSLRALTVSQLGFRHLLLHCCGMAARARIAALTSRLLNALGIPGFVGEADYHSESLGTRVSVRCGDQFTVISVNDVDVYFRRLSGRIDGVGSSSQRNSR